MKTVTRRTALTLALAGGCSLARPWPQRAAAAQGDLWTALREGRAVAVLRHALAPGTGDPADFQIDDCSTQRNLSDAGREQARAIGRRFRTNGIDQAQVRSSQWCRCLETAELLALGPVEPMPALNSFFRDRSSGPAQTDSLRAFLDERREEGPLVLVTHQVNITSLTGVFPSSGEMVVIAPEPGEPARVLGTIETSSG